MANFWDWVNKQANKQPTTGDELLYADALKNQEARNAANNQYAAAAAAAKSGNANSSSLQGTIDPDRAGAAAAPKKGLYDQTGVGTGSSFWGWINDVAHRQPATGDELLYADAMENEEKRQADKAAAVSADAALTGILAGAGALPKTKPSSNTTGADATPSSPTQPSTAPSSPTQPGTSGGDKVTYIDANGDAQKGTTTPSETPAQTEPQRTYLDELRDQYQKMYDDAVKANNDAAKAAAERALAQAEKGVGELGDQYGSLNKQLYRDYMESLRVLPQEMAARGYSGGMSESARLGLNTAYGERLNENEAARIAAIMQLRQQSADAEYQANAARDQANAQAQQNLYANMMNLILQQQQDAATKAQNMAQYGDFSGYLGLGYTQSEIDQMQKAWIAANPELAKELGYVKTPEPVYSSYSGSGGGKNNTPSAEQQANGRDLLSEAIQLKNGGTPYSQIAKALDEEAAAGTITTAQAEAAKRAAISSGLDNAYASMKKNTTQKGPVSGGRLITEGDFYSQILGGRK